MKWDIDIESDYDSSAVTLTASAKPKWARGKGDQSFSVGKNKIEIGSGWHIAKIRKARK